MTMMVIFKFRPKDGKLEDLVTFCKNALPKVRKYPGNRGVVSARQNWDDFPIAVVTYWDTEEDMENFIKWRKEEGDYGDLRLLLEGKPMIQSYNIFESPLAQEMLGEPGDGDFSGLSTGADLQSATDKVYKIDFSKSR